MQGRRRRQSLTSCPLLKKFPAYPSLYIDTHGGTYAPDTAAAIRGKAVLYRNPFYNELKKKS